MRGRWLDDLVKDLRYALRTLRRNPGFAAVAVLSLALGIGANTAIFSLINAVMLRTLPVKEPDRLVQITRLTPDGRPGVRVVSAVRVLSRQRQVDLRRVRARHVRPVDRHRRRGGVRARRSSCPAAYFTVLGIEPGRRPAARACRRRAVAASPAAVISDRYWQRRFGRSPSAIGKAVTIRDRVFTIVGVMPASFQSARAGYAAGSRRSRSLDDDERGAAHGDRPTTR